ncbi:MAG: radical SAM protein [Woeseiaceae bacterium]|nr:radical SAM protein [Woeseiaceae bacterium]NIP21971.1 radical SAM protein [Woeseiaceae bacterium]NIS91095.1 radical SAM protein [Woeseiaceae bacterium]
MKLGLIAMSATRAHNRELTELGFTLPGFVDRSRVIASLPSLGLLTLAGMTPREIDMEYIDVPDLSDVEGLPGEFDVVAISSFTAQMNEAYELADRYREAGTKVLLGGLHVTALPDEAAQHADAIVIGEGEPSWPELIGDLQRNRLQPVYDSRDRTFNLGKSPLPRFDLLDHDRYNRMTIQTARGCPFRCEFCAASMRLSPFYRVKPVRNVITELRHIKEFQPEPFIEFADDNTFVNKRHGKELMRALAKEHVRWFTETDISVATDAELLTLMRDAGCVQVLIGFESATKAGLAGVETRSNWKAQQFDDYMAAIDKIQGHGISVNGCFVLGMDNDGPECFQNVVDFVRDSNLYDVQITMLTAFPGTPLYDRLLEENRIIEKSAWHLCTLFDVNFQPKHMPPEFLESQFRWLVEQLYGEEFTHERHAKFHERQAALLASSAGQEVKLNEHHYG